MINTRLKDDASRYDCVASSPSRIGTLRRRCRVGETNQSKTKCVCPEQSILERANKSNTVRNIDIILIERIGVTYAIEARYCAKWLVSMGEERREVERGGNEEGERERREVERARNEWQ